jgi:hypothetical protein
LKSGDSNAFSTDRKVERLLAILALLLVCRFLWPLKANYNADWFNFKWAIGYFGEYFRRHGGLPEVFNTTQWGGIPAPIFYGNLSNPILGLLCSILAPGMVIRFAVIFVFAAQYYWIVQASRRLKAPWWVGHSIACLVIWATYPLTNLFNRSAMMEFFATALLICALSLAILLAYAPSRTFEKRYASRMMLCLTISAGTHPITAMFGVPFFFIIGLILWGALREKPERRRSILASLARWFPAALACLASWLYATAKFADHVAIRHQRSGVLVWPDTWDHWVTRFYPIPFDPRMRPGVSIYSVLVPYLDAQVNIPLLILFLTLSIAALSVRSKLGKSGRFLAAAIVIPLLLFVFFTWISLSTDSYGYLPPIFQMIQFAYRAVTYQNLALLLGVFLVLMTLQRSSTTKPTDAAGILKHPAVRVVALACILLSAYGVVVKRPHIRAGRTDRGNENDLLLPSSGQRQILTELPSQYYGFDDYTTPDLFIPLTDDETKGAVPAEFHFDSQSNFGNAAPLQLALPERSWVRTNVQAFPWNRFEIDGRDLTESDVRIYNGNGIALQIPAGSHNLILKFVPDRIWEILRWISLLTLFGWLFAEIVLSNWGRTPITPHG